MAVEPILYPKKTAIGAGIAGGAAGGANPGTAIASVGAQKGRLINGSVDRSMNHSVSG